MDSSKKHDKAHPYHKANIVSKLLVWWVKDLFLLGRRKDLEMEDLYNTLPQDQSSKLGDALERQWVSELQGGSPSLSRAVTRTFLWDMASHGTIYLVYSSAFRVGQALFLNKLIESFHQEEDDEDAGGSCWYAVGLISCSLCCVFAASHFAARGKLNGMRIRVALCSLLYRKVLRLSRCTTSQFAATQAVNLMANDAVRFDEAPMNLDGLLTPIQAIVITVCVWNLMGISAVIGVVTLVLLTSPLQILLGKLSAKYRLMVAERTDRRILLISEIITGIHMIKMYAWESPFFKMVQQARKSELNAVRKANYVRGQVVMALLIADRIAFLFTIMPYVLWGYRITASQVYAVLEMYNALKLGLAFYFPMALTTLGECQVSINRMQKFLLLEEISTRGTCVDKDSEYERGAVVINDVKAGWIPESNSSTLANITIHITPGTLCAVVGNVGCGKSSLLHTLLGELTVREGSMFLGGEVSYCCQEPWLFQGTVRRNVLFGEDFSDGHYREVMRACALDRDLVDTTLVGDKGISLSGGQRARVNLARAVYRKADIYLLDNPLASVDTQVARQLFRECICKFLAGKTRILITDQAQFLKEADLIIVLNNGHIDGIGNYEELKSECDIFSHLVDKTDDLQSTETAIQQEEFEETEKQPQIEKQGTEEEQGDDTETTELLAKGRVDKKVYSRYLLAGSSVFRVVLLVAMFVFSHGVLCTTDWWTSYWINQENVRRNITTTTIATTISMTTMTTSSLPLHKNMSTSQAPQAHHHHHHHHNSADKIADAIEILETLDLKYILNNLKHATVTRQDHHSLPPSLRGWNNSESTTKSYVVAGSPSIDMELRSKNKSESTTKSSVVAGLPSIDTGLRSKNNSDATTKSSVVAGSPSVDIELRSKNNSDATMKSSVPSESPSVDVELRSKNNSDSITRISVPAESPSVDRSKNNTGLNPSLNGSNLELQEENGNKSQTQKWNMSDSSQLLNNSSYRQHSVETNEMFPEQEAKSSDNHLSTKSDSTQDLINKSVPESSVKEHNVSSLQGKDSNKYNQLSEVLLSVPSSNTSTTPAINQSISHSFSKELRDSSLSSPSSHGSNGSEVNKAVLSENSTFKGNVANKSVPNISSNMDEESHLSSNQSSSFADSDRPSNINSSGTTSNIYSSISRPMVKEPEFRIVNVTDSKNTVITHSKVNELETHQRPKVRSIRRLKGDTLAETKKLYLVKNSNPTEGKSNENPNSLKQVFLNARNYTGTTSLIPEGRVVHRLSKEYIVENNHFYKRLKREVKVNTTNEQNINKIQTDFSKGKEEIPLISSNSYNNITSTTLASNVRTEIQVETITKEHNLDKVQSGGKEEIHFTSKNNDNNITSTLAPNLTTKAVNYGPSNSSLSSAADSGQRGDEPKADNITASQPLNKTAGLNERVQTASGGRNLNISNMTSQQTQPESSSDPLSASRDCKKLMSMFLSTSPSSTTTRKPPSQSDSNNRESTFNPGEVKPNNSIHKHINRYNGSSDMDRTLMTESSEHDSERYLWIYTALVASTMVLMILRTNFVMDLCVSSSKGLHDKMFSSVLHTTTRFFDVNPAGRIMNRFSKDVGTVDELIPSMALLCAQIIFVAAGIVVLAAIQSIWILIPFVIASFLFWKICQIYLATADDVKRLEGVARSPVFSHLSATLDGLATIRASKMESLLKHEFDNLQDEHTSAWSLTIHTNAFLNVWTDLICTVFMACSIAIFILLASDMPPGAVGLALSQLLVMLGMASAGMVFCTTLANWMVSVERLVQYTELQPEPGSEPGAGQRPPRGWPALGALEVDNLDMSYAGSGPVVLRNINLQILPGEKVGVVGRTGAGKSSMAASLFRMAPSSKGKIKIDGLDIERLNLKDLRENLSIIPQKPILFSAPIRVNLDPTGTVPDDQLWSALAQVELKDAVPSLEFVVHEGGSNFSVGQRQLICLARVILRKNKILVLDEATANVDPRTDALIQKTIRLQFKDCTVMAIAHRLNTIMDYDRVLVLDHGEVKEFDHPYLLLQNPDSALNNMVQKTDQRTAQHLRKMAEEAYKQKYAEDLQLHKED